jgi:hypothetical protein
MRLRTTAAAGVLFAAVLSLGTGTANAADRDCPDFTSQAAAQAAFNAVPGDPERLDADDDGKACEDHSYPGTTTTGQVSTRPVGAVAAGDGSSTDDGSALPYLLGGLALVGAGGAAVAARRSARGTA